ncbi:SH2 domain protein [Cooperia oncophora]
MMMCIPGATVRQTTRINVPILFQLVDKTLTTHIWYHGMIPRKEVEDMLKIQGDYLVRKTTVARQITYCLSVKHTSDTKHVPLVYDKGTWTLKDVGAWR